MSAPMQFTVPSQIQAAVDSDAWMEFVAEHREKNEGDTCPKDGSRLTWDGYLRRYSCDECGWSEAPPKQ